jgi:hypothetical protein
MCRDIISVHSALELSEFMELSMNVTDEKGNKMYMINPSKSAKCIYFRTVLENDIFTSGVCLFKTVKGDFVTFPSHDDCPNIEDLRIFDYRNRVWFVGYMRNANKLFETYIGYFDKGNTCIEKLAGVIRTEGEHVKNVTPLVDKGSSVAWFVDIYTGSVYGDDLQVAHQLDKTLLEQRLSGFSNSVFGTTQYVHIDGTVYGGLAHMTKKIGTLIFYVYLWVEIDIANWSVCYVSEPYVIHKLGVVFVSYIEKLDDGRYQLMFGVDDKITCRGVATLAALRGVVA